MTKQKMKIMLVNPPNCGRSIPEEEYGITSFKVAYANVTLQLSENAVATGSELVAETL